MSGLIAQPALDKPGVTVVRFISRGKAHSQLLSDSEAARGTDGAADVSRRITVLFFRAIRVAGVGRSEYVVRISPTPMSSILPDSAEHNMEHKKIDAACMMISVLTQPVFE